MTRTLRPIVAFSVIAVLFGSGFVATGQTNNGQNFGSRNTAGGTSAQNRGLQHQNQQNRQLSNQRNRGPITAQRQPQAAQAGVRRNQQTVALRAPSGFPLPANHEKYVDQLLSYWESSSAKVDRLRCNFKRWKYDSTVCNYIDPTQKRMVPHEISTGNIQFGKPDKALVAVETKRIVLPPSAGNPKLQIKDYKGKHKDEHKERWACNGKMIYYFDYFKQQMIQSELPRDMQGQGLKNSPLPFFFGAKAADLKSRYWIKSVTPKGAKNEWWLEFYPKRRQDGEFYSKTIVILEGQSFLPKTIQLFKPSHNPNKVKLADGSVRPAIIQYDVYEFSTREVNFRENLIKLWNDNFNPRPPFGWRTVNKTLGSNQPNHNVRQALAPNGMRK